MTRKHQNLALYLNVVLLSGILASPAEAITVPFTDSNQLNLSGRNVLSAVSFYDSTPTQVDGGVAVTGTIQGHPITNFDYPLNTTIGELTVSLPNPTTDRGQTGAGSRERGPIRRMLSNWRAP